MPISKRNRAKNNIHDKTAHAVEQRRKRKDEEARQRAEAQREAERRNAAEEARKAQAYLLAQIAAQQAAQEQSASHRGEEAKIERMEEAEGTVLAAAKAAKPQHDEQAYQDYRAGERNAETIAADYQARKAVQEYRQGERAEYVTPLPVCTVENVEKPKPWWQQAGDWVQQKIVQPVQDFAARWSEPPNASGPLYPKLHTTTTLLQAGSYLLDRALFNGRLTQTALEWRESANRFVESRPALQTTLNVTRNLVDFGTGFASQVLDDFTFGLYGRLTGIAWSNGSDAFQNGRTAGRVVSNVWGQMEIAAGAALALTSIELITPTAGGAAACAALTGGICAPLGGAALVIETAGVLAGGALAAHGLAVQMRNAGNPVSNSLPGHPDARLVKSKTPRGPAREYEARVLNKPDPNVEIEVNGVNFDWYKGDTLLDAKNAAETRSWYDVSQADGFTQRVKVPDIIEQAQRQVEALQGSSFNRIEWRVADPKVAEALQALFDLKGLKITVIYVP